MTQELNAGIKRLKKRIAGACRRSKRLEDSVRIIVVTKTHSVETAQSVIDAGIKDIAENKVQELAAKAPLLKGAKELHMVGHLQSNKISKVVPLVDWIQSVDSEKLIDKINKQCEDRNKSMNVLIQVNTSGEESKSGCKTEEAYKLCEKASASPNIKYRGLMTIGPLEGGEKETRESFEILRRLGEKTACLCESRPELSMGMSDDFEWAIEEGATMIRIGSLLLGKRNYK
jgi:hypothetical protein